MKPTPEQRLWMYEAMYRSRRLDEAVLAVYMEGKTPVFHMGKGPLPGEMHQSFGQEPCAAGVCVHLGADDAVGAGHRPHHVAIARGVNLKRMAAELFGKKTGLSGGRGGHMHLYDATVNFFCSGIIAEGMGPGAGMALARKMMKKPGIAVAFVGDGAANQGAFHEVMNMVGLWKLPFICVIEDNKYGVSVSKRDSTAVAHNSDRASAYAVAGEYVTLGDNGCVLTGEAEPHQPDWLGGAAAAGTGNAGDRDGQIDRRGCVRRSRLGAAGGVVRRGRGGFDAFGFAELEIIAGDLDRADHDGDDAGGDEQRLDPLHHLAAQRRRVRVFQCPRAGRFEHA